NANVAQHEGNTVAAELLQRLVARACRVHLELLLRQILSERVADGLLIVDDEDLEAPRGLDHARLLREAPARRRASMTCRHERYRDRRRDQAGLPGSGQELLHRAAAVP